MQLFRICGYVSVCAFISCVFVCVREKESLEGLCEFMCVCLREKEKEGESHSV